MLSLAQRMLKDLGSEDQPLMEAGLDSLGAVELRASLASAFSLGLPATLTFDYPSVAAMASYIHQAQANQPSTTASLVSYMQQSSFLSGYLLGPSVSASCFCIVYA